MLGRGSFGPFSLIPAVTHSGNGPPLRARGSTLLLIVQPPQLPVGRSHLSSPRHRATLSRVGASTEGAAGVHLIGAFDVRAATQRSCGSRMLVRGVPRPFHASNGSWLASGAGKVTTKPRRSQAHSASVPSHSGALAEPVVGPTRARCRVHAARRAATLDATRRRQRGRAGRLRRTNYGGHSRRSVCRPSNL